LDSSLSTLLPANDPAKRFYDQVVRRFGSDDINVIGIVAPDVFTPETLSKIKRITDLVQVGSPGTELEFAL
jgi:Predicted exporters of the RND superfamily